MTTQEYIDSGVLELYAAGGLSEAERLEVESMSDQFPAVKEALENTLRAMEAYALTHAQVPPTDLEDKIIAHLSAQMEYPGATQPQAAKPVGKVLPLNRPVASVKGSGSGSTLNQRLQWAATVLLVISAFTNFYLYRQVQEKEQDLLATRQLARQYVYQTNQLEQQKFQTESALAVLGNSLTAAVPLKATAPNSPAAGKVFYNPQSKEVYLDKSQLPAAPAGKQYQLWALLDGQPIDAGTVALAGDNLQRMKAIPEAQAFAVTLEPEGGSAAPTLEAMVVMGEI